MKKILLADDSITIQKVVELTFSEGDYQVICVSNGAQALKKISESRPDVVLLDVIMPEKNGYEVCEAIKKSPATSGIPVLLLTGTFEPFDKKRAETVGAQGHLTKPFESQALVSKVEELIAATPGVVSNAEAGGMDVISGGDVYHVDPGRAAEGLRPMIPPGQPAPPIGPESPVRMVRTGLERVAEPVPAPPPVPERSQESGEAEWSRHPAMAAPDPAAGGSYVGFADLGVDISDEPEIVPDRFDDVADPAASTTRLNREALFGRKPPSEGGFGTREEAGGPAERIEGLTGAFEREERAVPATGPRPPTTTEEPAWTPPPEAPPAETWQAAAETETLPQESRSDEPRSRPRPAIGGATAGSGNGGLGLTPEAIELIAERVVERLSDRVVREIAWEVIPQVAEALVRRRIKELEKGESS